MKNKKEFYYNLLTFIFALVLFVAGFLMIKLSHNENVITAGIISICISPFILIWGIVRAVSLRKANKEERQFKKKQLARKREQEKLINEAFKAFDSKTDYPEKNTLKIVDAGMEFFAEGRYVCVKDFKNIKGYHLAFEISSTGLKHKSEDYDDVCDLEGNGVFIVVGYHDGEALEEYANDNGVIMQNTPENSIGKTITLKPDKGYVAYIWTADGDEIDYGFVKILKCENDVLTVQFLVSVDYGLCDTVEGVVELKKDTDEDTHDIQSIINRIKRKRFNTIEVSGEEVQEIKKANLFLPESYITFLSEVGNVDFGWLDMGWNGHTPTNLADSDTEYVKEILDKYEGKNYALEDFYFIGIDNADRYYAFSRKPNDEKVYLFAEDLLNARPYENFEEFLTEILNV